ncbi:MAG TPA: hypothetical protein VFP37_07270 [Steroidobacteraceae bacterium]|nr:hypothetical protein [Steroidobacteraceae bacterium]
MVAPGSTRTDGARVLVAGASLLVAIGASALATGMVVISIMSCLVSCGPTSSGAQLLFFAIAGVALLAAVVCIVNFLLRLRRHGWSNLNGWEKSVAYVAIAALVAPLLVDLVFWLLYGVSG